MQDMAEEEVAPSTGRESPRSSCRGKQIGTPPKQALGRSYDVKMLTDVSCGQDVVEEEAAPSTGREDP